MKIGLGIGLINKSTSGGAAFPVNIVAPVISGTTVVGSTLSCTTGTWTGSPNTFIYGYQWRRNGVAIIGANSNTYVTTLADSGAVITCVVTANNCGIALPSNTVAPAISGTAVVGQTLTTANGTWNGTPLTYDYRWFRGTTQIGTNSNSYTLLQSDASNTSNITCIVTANNTAGSANATSNQIAQILTVRTNSFLTASAIIDTTIRSALNTLDVGLISNSIDTKMKALYPFVGGTASTHKFNFMNAADTDAAFRLLFAGTWTHSSTGATPNGTNGFANTFFNPSINLGIGSGHFSKYNRNNDLGGDKIDGVTSLSGGATAFFQQNYSAGTNGIGVTSTLISYTPTDTKGLITTTRTTTTSVKAFRNTTQLGSTNTAVNTGLPNANVFVGARSSGAGVALFFNSYECAFLSIGDGFTDSELSIFYNLVQAFQTTLGRNV